MQRSPSFIATFALALIFCPTGRAQDSPSLGDLARQAQKDKVNKPSAKVITDDDVHSNSSGISSAIGGGHGRVLQPGSAGNPGSPQSTAEGLQKLQASVDHLDSLDRATLATDVLEGNDSNFPGRDKWEEKLFAAKGTFVSQIRAVLQKAKQLSASAEGIKNAEDPNDPRVKNLAAKLQQLAEETQRDSAAFAAVVVEGKALAAHPATQ
jgi:hypothetical protein